MGQCFKSSLGPETKSGWAALEVGVGLGLGQGQRRKLRRPSAVALWEQTGTQ